MSNRWKQHTHTQVPPDAFQRPDEIPPPPPSTFPLPPRKKPTLIEESFRFPQVDQEADHLWERDGLRKAPGSASAGEEVIDDLIHVHRARPSSGEATNMWVSERRSHKGAP